MGFSSSGMLSSAVAFSSESDLAPPSLSFSPVPAVEARFDEGAFRLGPGLVGGAEAFPPLPAGAFLADAAPFRPGGSGLPLPFSVRLRGLE